jgi:phosphoribosylglycinamide formyltransferase-1
VASDGTDTPRRLRLAVLISGSGSNLQALIDAQRAGTLAADIGVVISNRADAYGLTRAARAGIATRVLSHGDFASRSAYDQALAVLLREYEPGLVVLAGFMRILTPAFVAGFRGRMLNIHPSLLPKYPGLHTHQRALDAGDTEHGATVHFVTEELDGGPAIVQARVRVLPGDDAERLAARVLEQEHRIYPLAVRWFAQGRLRLDEAGRAVLDHQPLHQALDLAKVEPDWPLHAGGHGA